MLKFFFGRHSRFARGIELLGVILAVIIIKNIAAKESLILADYLYSVLIAQYLFIRFCHAYPWYPQQRKKYPAPKGDLGIEVHFIKALVPASYTLTISSLLFLFGLELVAALVANLLFAVVTGVNGILIGFHIRDNDPLPINYFTHNWHLKDDRVRAPTKWVDEEVPEDVVGG